MDANYENDDGGHDNGENGHDNGEDDESFHDPDLNDLVTDIVTAKEFMDMGLHLVHFSKRRIKKERRSTSTLLRKEDNCIDLPNSFDWSTAVSFS